jgi:hypothetical protein
MKTLIKKEILDAQYPGRSGCFRLCLGPGRSGLSFHSGTRTIMRVRGLKVRNRVATKREQRFQPRGIFAALPKYFLAIA